MVGDPEKRTLLEWAFNAWSRVQTSLPGLPRQFIHGDLNRENILVENDRISGIVDFGDCCMNPAVSDLAICVTYFMLGQENPLQPMDQVIAGYEQIRPLRADERAAVLPLVCGRLATSAAIAAERLLIDPGNPNWFQDQDAVWGLIGQLKELEEG